MGRDESDAATRARIDGLLCQRCWRNRECCTCAPARIVVRRPSGVVRLLQSLGPEGAADGSGDTGSPAEPVRRSVAISGLNPAVQARLRGGAA